ncbi:MAG TPA: response regulator [Candidatus Competibacteraceae bacterium]|nr:response regulator [Candidatus Competibacteraceae bacterium]
MRILHIGGDTARARWLRDRVNAAIAAGTLSPLLELHQVANLGDALLCLAGEPPVAVILLELNLPDSQGVATLITIRALAPTAAIVVLADSRQPPLAKEALRQGAQDYLMMDQSDEAMLLRSLRYALEWQLWQVELERLRRQHDQERELHSLERLTGPGPGERDNVQRLLRDYTALVRSYVCSTRLNQPRPSAKVRALARRLAGVHAGAHDVVRLHLKVLEGLGCWSKSSEERAFANDARLALVELMGNLIDIYLAGEARSRL